MYICTSMIMNIFLYLLHVSLDAIIKSDTKFSKTVSFYLTPIYIIWTFLKFLRNCIYALCPCLSEAEAVQALCNYFIMLSEVKPYLGHKEIWIWAIGNSKPFKVLCEVFLFHLKLKTHKCYINLNKKISNILQQIIQ